MFEYNNFFEGNDFFDSVVSKLEFESPLHHDPISLKTDPNARYVRSTFSVISFNPGEFMSKVLLEMNKSDEDKSKHRSEVTNKTKNYSLCLQINTDLLFQLDGEKIKFIHE